MSVLRDAFGEVCERRDAFDEVGDYDEARLLDVLADVVDHAGRIADVNDSTLYRADRSSTLVEAALIVRREALLSYAGGGADDVIFDSLHDLTTIAVEVEAKIREAMWAWAERRPVPDLSRVVNPS